MSKFTVTVKNRPTGVEGVYQLPNSTPSKLARKDGSTVFPNRGSLTQAAQRLATTIGWQYELAEVQKKAAKKSVKTSATKAKTTAKKAPTKKTSSKATASSKNTTCSNTSSCEKNS
jgi:hypothetical protein